ncbi:BTB/POZ domain-containing protein 6-like isoform X1 [Mya arenaria]|uniref:BTB/POZ domain-containing protein 6-like isoform X1 n=1 Tax=Mya arenaria TaxID=6604 RepID=UPI0022E14142|nr:BTB/POZ domain-containing protein 6-like isoform X1 [Mya arenaria]
MEVCEEERKVNKQMMEITMHNKSEDPWQYSDDFAETNLQLLETQILSDIAFSFEDGKEVVRAHKNILSSRSPVFYTMFCGPLQESSAVIEIPDVDTIIFKQFLRFLYTKSCDVNADSVMYLIYLSKKYDVPSLQNTCREFLKKGFNVENVCTILGQALHFQEVDLQRDCLNFISKKTAKVLKSVSFLSLPPSTVELILQEESLKCYEIDVYFALKAWAVKACKQKGNDHANTDMIREEIGCLLRLVRFPTLSAKDFATHVTDDGILTQAEKLDIYRDIILGESVSGYPTKRRQRPTFRVKRFKSVNAEPWLHGNKIDGISFTVSRPCRLIGAILYRPIHEGMVGGKISVYEDGVLKGDIQETVYFAPEKKTSNVLIPEVQLDPVKTYGICQTFTGKGTYSGKEPHLSHVVNDVKIQFGDMFCGKGMSSISTGQICGIIIDVELNVDN